MRWVRRLIVVVLVASIGTFAYHFSRSQAETAAFRQRLKQLSGDYATLQTQYNLAVAKTAVTELVVEDGKLSVAVVTLQDEIKRIPTSCDPKSEVHVDYVVADGRLWIRRVYDSNTPASEATVIDPKLAHIDWGSAGKRYGLTVYRTLGEGRWVVSATASGALSLRKKAPGETRAKLTPPPQLVDFEQVERDIKRDVEAVGPLEALLAMLAAR